MLIYRKSFTHSKILPQIKDWQNRPLDEVYPILYIDAIHYSVRVRQSDRKMVPKYPNSMKRWKDNWEAISPIFKFSATAPKVIYTTNAIESLNSTYRKLNRQRSVFLSDTELLTLYLATFGVTKKWTATIRNWAQVYGELNKIFSLCCSKKPFNNYSINMSLPLRISLIQ